MSITPTTPFGFRPGEVPIGGLIHYAGTRSHLKNKNWLICNGQAVSPVAYRELFERLGYSHGKSDKTDPQGEHLFHVPDLRGMFVRGVADGTATDPDHADRKEVQNSGNKGDNVGSRQDWSTGNPGDDIKTTGGEHAHEIGYAIGDVMDPGQKRFKSYGDRGDKRHLGKNGAHSHPLTGFGNETRPVNIALWLIIRAKQTQTPLNR